MISTAEQAEREFDKALGEALRKYPRLKTEILQSFVRDTREAIVMHGIANSPSEEEIQS